MRHKLTRENDTAPQRPGNLEIRGTRIMELQVRMSLQSKRADPLSYGSFACKIGRMIVFGVCPMKTIELIQIVACLLISCGSEPALAGERFGFFATISTVRGGIPQTDPHWYYGISAYLFDANTGIMKSCGGTMDTKDNQTTFVSMTATCHANTYQKAPTGSNFSFAQDVWRDPAYDLPAPFTTRTSWEMYLTVDNSTGVVQFCSRLPPTLDTYTCVIAKDI